MSMTPRERVLAAMKKESLDRPPAAIFTQSATLSQMDACGAAWPEAHKSAELMAKLGAAQADYDGFECVRAPFCLTAETERLGATVAVDKRDANPMVKMSPEEFLQGGRPAEAIKAMGLLKKSHGEKYAVVAGNTGPFTLTGNLVSAESIVFGMMMDPDQVAKWVAAVNPIVKAYTNALLDAGADVVQCSEPSASVDMLAPDMFETASGQYVRESLAPGQDRYTVLHICGDTTQILEPMVAAKTTGISIEEKVDSFKAVEMVGKKTVLVGNVGSVRPLFQGTPEEVVPAVKHSMDAGFDVISSGCGIAVATPDANMKIFAKTVKGE